MLFSIQRICLVTIVVALAACASRSPHVDRGFGDEVRTIAAQQVRDPNASQKNQTRAVDGIDGRAAKQAMDKYQRSFGEPPKTINVLSIGLGGAEGQGGGR